MSTVTQLNEVFAPRIDWVVEDVNKDGGPVVDGKYVIGRVLGEFFVPDGESRNLRFYTESLWKKVLGNQDVGRRMGERKIFGTIGHDEEPVTEQQLRRGEVSHIVTRLWIDEDASGVKRGMGEALILSTPAGQYLNTYLRAGCRLNTSSRASGSLAEGRDHNGIPVVDEDTYVFETFDFVLDPGFLQAKPDLVEQLGQLQSEHKEANTMPEDTMGTKLVEASMRTLQESRDALQHQLGEAIAAKNATEASLKEANRRLESLARVEHAAPVLEKLGLSADTATRIPRVMEDLGLNTFAELVKFLEGISPKDAKAIQGGKISEKLATLEAYQTKVAATPQRGVQIGERAAAEISSYRKLGSVKELTALKEAYAKQSKEIAVISKGGINEARRALLEAKRELDAFAAMGTRQEITEALQSALVLLKQYRELGTPAKLRESLSKAEEVVAFVEKIGGKKKVTEAIRKYNESVKRRRESFLSSQSEALSSKHQVPVTDVRSLVESVGAEKADTILAGISKRPGPKALTERKDGSPVIKKQGNGSFCEGIFKTAGAKLG